MKKFYITTSIVYTNAPPHLGFALESIQADVLARYHRQLKEGVFFLTGTDEHGIKIERKAKEVKKEPKEFVDEISGKYKELKRALNLSNDEFIRTTDQKRHWPVVKDIWLKLEKKGDIYKKKYKGFYCAGCEAFIPERELIDGKCPVHKKKPEVVEEENYFFRLSKYTKEIKEIIRKDKIKIIPENRKNEILYFINQGLEDVSFSRKKIKWGIPVPNDPEQMIYVWADALSNYISGLDKKSFKDFWPPDVHCIGKDILKFHALIWPAMLLSLGFKLPKVIFVHGFITVDGQKMSKSLGNIVDPFELVEKYGADPVRYYLLREISPTEDGDFTFEKFQTRYNSELASGIGNLVARVRAMAEKTDVSYKHDKKIEAKIKQTSKKHKIAIESFRFNDSLKAIWELISFSDKYIEKEKPWEGKENATQTLGALLVILDNITEIIKPILPETSEKMHQIIKRDKRSQKFENKTMQLFPRI